MTISDRLIKVGATLLIIGCVPAIVCVFGGIFTDWHVMAFVVGAISSAIVYLIGLTMACAGAVCLLWSDT